MKKTKSCWCCSNCSRDATTSYDIEKHVLLWYICLSLGCSHSCFCLKNFSKPILLILFFIFCCSLSLQSCQFLYLKKNHSYYNYFLKDYRHPGVTNQYLHSTSDSKILVYGSEMVLESFHCTAALRYLNEDQNNLLKNLPPVFIFFSLSSFFLLCFFLLWPPQAGWFSNFRKFCMQWMTI